MHKKTLNILAVCTVSLIIVFTITRKVKIESLNAGNIVVDDNGEIITKADQYQSNILDAITEQNIKKFTEFTKSFEKNSEDNLTDGLSKDIFSQYLKYNTSGEIKEQDVLNVAQDVLKRDTSVENPINYQDISTVNSTISNLRDYGNNLSIIQNSLNKGILSIEKKNNKTPYIINIYKKIVEILIATPVPESLAQNHLTLTNGFIKYTEGLTMLDQQMNDPAKSLLGLKKMKEATDEIVSSLDKIKKTIDLNNILYAPTEPGFLLNKAN